MKWKVLLVLGTALLAAQSRAVAAPITYEGSIVVGGAPVSGFVGPFTLFDSADLPHSQFWSFSGIAGQLVSIRGTRQNANLDPAFTLYSGTITAGTDYSLYDPFASFDSVTFLAFGDDEVSVPGPFGDPLVTMTLPTTGQYTIAFAGGASDCPGGVCPAGGYPYQLEIQAVPEPSTLSLLASACLTAGWNARRRFRSTQKRG